MGVKIYGEAIVEFQSQQVVTNTTVSGCSMPFGVVEVMVNCAAATTMQISPRLEMCCKTVDNGATFIDYSEAARDRDTSTVVVLSSLDTAANGDYWYLASKYKFAGCVIDLATPNATVSVMTGYYWNGTAWADASITDNTPTGGATLALETATKDSVTWATPATWKKTTLNGVSGLYVIRFQVSAALDSDTTLAGITLVGDTTNHAGGYLAASTDYVFTLNSAVSGGLTFIAGAGSTANVTWMRHTNRGES